jgi:hypothetical protein
MCYESALKAFKCLCEDGHSGFSISCTKAILDRLLDCKPLTPLSGNDDEWGLSEHLNDHDGLVTYQNKRYGALFKEVKLDGTITYRDVDRVVCYDIRDKDKSYFCGAIAYIINDMFPITMPYFPENSPIKVYCFDFLVDKKHGDFDTYSIDHIIMPNGDNIDIQRYFKENDDGNWEEIGEEEFLTRLHNEIR